MEVINSLSIPEFINLKKMLLSTEEDKAIAVSNLKNMEIDPVYIVLLIKQCRLDDRKHLTDEFNDIFSNKEFSRLSKTINHWSGSSTILDLSWDKLYSVIKEHYNSDMNVKTIFEHEFKKDWLGNIIKGTTWTFVDDIQLKLKW